MSRCGINGCTMLHGHAGNHWPVESEAQKAHREDADWFEEQGFAWSENGASFEIAKAIQEAVDSFRIWRGIK